jgi:hypothetical protein
VIKVLRLALASVPLLVRFLPAAVRSVLSEAQQSVVSSAIKSASNPAGLEN